MYTTCLELAYEHRQLVSLPDYNIIMQIRLFVVDCLLQIK
jgi:hypothetical protein